MKYCYTNERLKKQSGAAWKMLILIFILLNSLVFKMSAQGTTVSGAVVDEKNQPLTGVNVVIKGKTTGTITDLDGKFTINAESTDVLSFTFVGFKTEEIAVGSQTQMTVTLKEEVTALNEVVVVGYGVQKKSDLTGAVASIKADDIKNMPVTRVDEALQGKAAGVIVLQNSGQPGSDPKIRVRGLATVNGGNPLIIIDGVSGGSLKDLNPNDIESMEVLKDAASQAIYGSAGGNGVILVTTKRGKAGLHVNFDAYWGMQQPWSKDNTKICNSQQFAKLYNLSKTGTFPYDSTLGFYLNPSDTISSTPLLETNWPEKIFRNATVQSYNIAVNGGTKKTTYYSGLGYSNEEGTLLRTYNKKYTFKLNADCQLLKRVKIGENFNFNYNVSANQGERNEYGSPLSCAIQSLPYVPVFAEDGSGNYAYKVKGIKGLSNNVVTPLAQIAYNNNIAWANSIFGNVYMKLELIKGLSFETHYGAYSYSSLSKTFTPRYTIGETAEPNSSQSKANSEFHRYPSSGYGWQWQNYFTYDFSIAEKHVFNAVAGMEANYNKKYANENLIVTNVDNNIDWVHYTDTAGLIVQNPENMQEWTKYAYFARLNYTFANILLLQGNIRYDNSSKFGPNKRSGAFPAISAGIKFSEIDFIKDLNIIDFGKIRAGYGETGNDDIEPFLYSGAYANLPIMGSYFGGIRQAGAGQITAGNPDLKWEKVVNSNVGIDLGFLKNRLSISVDYFIRSNKDMLLRKTVPYTVGYRVSDALNELGNASIDTRPLVNYGTLDNKGFEISLGYKDKIGDFTYDLNGNITSAKTKIKDIGEPIYNTGNSRGVSNVCKTSNGQSVSEFYGYKTNGYYKEEDFVWYLNKKVGAPTNIWKRLAPDPNGTISVKGYSLNGDSTTNTTFSTTAKPGDFKYVDVNKDGQITSDDMTNIGDPNPKFTYGFGANLSYKNIDLSMFFQGSYGNKIFNLLKINLYSINNGGLNLSPDLLNAYVPAVYNITNKTKDPVVVTPESNTNSSMQSMYALLNQSDFFVEDGSYLRLKNIQIGYTLPLNITKSVKIEKLRIYVGAKNLLTFTKYTGFDPEVGENGILERGYDRGTYPQSRMFLFGVNMIF